MSEPKIEDWMDDAAYEIECGINDDGDECAGDFVGYIARNCPYRWRPIADAPRRDSILGYSRTVGACIAAWDEAEYSWSTKLDGPIVLTHWMPLPPPPPVKEPT